MSHWLYEIHNDVNNKLRSQKIAVEPNPTYNEIKERYAKWAAMPCASTQVLGWDFLFSVANTTPMRGALSPMDGAPDTCDDPLLRNQWNMMNYKERIPYYKKWWNLIEDVLPFEPWRKAWFAARGTHGQAPIEKGKRAVLSWLFSMEQTICKKMAEDAPHDSFYGLCKEVSAFSSGCGKKTSRRVKTCRAKKDAARETLRRARNARNSNNVA
jgi:hypothetical protein